MVPSTNPFFGQEPACDEVYLMGLRNPFRYSFDRSTGDIYIGDVGQGKWEEINLKPTSIAGAAQLRLVVPRRVRAPRRVSGCMVPGCIADPVVGCQFPRGTGSFYDPILCHHSSDGWHSIMGGYRYRGARVPSIAASYLYGDAFCGQIWKTTTLDPSNPSAIDASCWASGFGGTYGFAEDHLGELYVVVGGAGGGSAALAASPASTTARGASGRAGASSVTASSRVAPPTGPAARPSGATRHPCRSALGVRRGAATQPRPSPTRRLAARAGSRG